MQQYDIFISYKRLGTSSTTAAYLYNMLLQKGYNVFFDRKEMRSGKFNIQLLDYIAGAKDIIILLEPDSLNSWFKHREETTDEEQPYKTDWFCKEVMHALAHSEGKHIIPILLNGYQMPAEADLPEEMKDLPDFNAPDFDISEVDEFYSKVLVERNYLQSKPQNLALSRQYHNGSIVGQFLFHTQAASCDLYERGEHIITLTDDCDLHHPFAYPVQFAGEHCFRLVNNDTCEERIIRKRIEVSSQEYIEVEWDADLPCVWQLTEEQISMLQLPNRLLHWGQCLFEGNSKNPSDLGRAAACMEQAISLGSEEAAEFVSNHGNVVEHPNDMGKIRWLTLAANLGSADAQNQLGVRYGRGQVVEKNDKIAAEWFAKAAEQGHMKACSNLGFFYRKGRGVEQNDEKSFYWSMIAAKMDYPPAMNRVAWLLHEKGKAEEALPFAEKAVAARPNSASMADTLAFVYQDLGRYSEALELFERSKAIYLEKGYPENAAKTDEKIANLRQLLEGN